MKCSVIIPAYNSEKTIAACLESTLNQDISNQEYEVTLIDDGSTDNTRTIASRFPVKVIQQANHGPAVARNNGASQANSDILIFTDSDCELDSHFIDKITTPMKQNPEIIGVQGSYITRQKEFMARFAQVEIETRYKKMAVRRYIDFIGTYAAAYRKDVFDNYGGFDTGFTLASGEDTEFSYKLHRNGFKMVFEPQAYVYHHHPSTLLRYLKTKFFRGYWRVRLYKKHPEKTISDSYTPQSLKLQVLLIPLFLISLIMAIFNAVWLAIPALIFASFLFFSIPFIRLFRQKNYTKSFLIPAVLFLRAAAIFLGLLFGIAHELAESKKTKFSHIVGEQL